MDFPESTYLEQLVTHHETKHDIRRRMVVLVITALFILIWLHIIFIPAMIALQILTIAIAYFVLRIFFNKEYEYCFVDGELDIDVIYNKSYRRRVFKGEVLEFEMFAHFSDSEHLDFYKNFKFKDYSGGIVTPNTYIFVTSYKGKKTRFAIEPNDELIDLICRRMQHGKFFKKVNAEDKI